MVELLIVIAIIGILALSAPSISFILGSARDSSVSWQEKSLNNTYQQYLASGGLPALSLEEALEILATHPDFQIAPPTTMEGGDGELQLTFQDQLFAYLPGGASVASAGDNRKLTGEGPLVLNVRRAGGTASYGGQDFGFGPMPEFMLMANSGAFSFYNSGGYENMEMVHALGEFLEDLPPSEDRFNPTHTKTLSLEKSGTRYDLEFALWDGGDQLRLLQVFRFQ